VNASAFNQAHSLTLLCVEGCTFSCYNIVVTEADMQIKIRKMGNSQGIIIPQAILAQLGVAAGDAFDVNLDGDELHLTPVTKRRVREGWKEACDEMIAAGEAGPVWPEFGNAADGELEW
jgi:antitoxin MazE